MDLFEKVTSRRNSTSDQQITIQSCNCPDLAAQPIYDNVPRLRRGISSHLSNLRFQSNNRDSSYLSPEENTRYQFAKAY
ncbi:jg6314, partial [Pararge aegeria aegeria]